MADDDKEPHGYNKQRDIIVGLRIFAAHGGKFCSAEHDVFYAGQADGEKLTPSEVDTLHAHGWIIMGEVCSGCAEDSDAEAFTEEDGDRHLLDCTSWGLFT